MSSLARKFLSLDVDNSITRPVARYVLLARKIHAKFTQAEEKEKTALRTAQETAKRKNDAVLQSVNEVVEFCQILRQVPGLSDQLDNNAKDIAERLLSNRYAYEVEKEPIALRYNVPVFHVDINAPDGTAVTGAGDAYLYVGFSPVRIAPSSENPLNVPTMTTHTFFSKKYRIEADGRITENRQPADPMSDILTELRSLMGHDYFEDVLLPYLEAQAIVIEKNRRH